MARVESGGTWWVANRCGGGSEKKEKIPRDKKSGGGKPKKGLTRRLRVNYLASRAANAARLCLAFCFVRNSYLLTPHFFLAFFFFFILQEILKGPEQEMTMDGASFNNGEFEAEWQSKGWDFMNCGFGHLLSSVKG